MTKAKSTRRALLSSALALLLCVSMLVGSTFAWFTDSVTSGSNKIVSGKLDVQLLMDTGSGYADISNSDKPIFGTGSIAQNNNAETLWEPGKTQVAYLAIKNNGNLALKYTVALDVENVSKNLYEVMKYDIIEDAQYGSVTSWEDGASVELGMQAVSDTVSLGVGATHYFALAIHMDEAAGNAYQAGEVNFDLTVLATQDTVEYDSFDDQYDKDASFGVHYASTKAELMSLVKNAEEGDIIYLMENIDLGSNQLAVEKNITVDLNGNTVTADFGYGIISLKNGASIKNGTIDVKSNVAAIRAFNVGVIEDVTINIAPKATDKVSTAIAVQNGGYVGTIKNVTIAGGATQGIEVGKGAKVDLIENADVTTVSNGSKAGIALQINAGYVGKAVDSTFNGEAYGVHMMLNGEFHVALTLEDCDVTGGKALYAHDEVGIDNSTNCSLTLNYDEDTVFTGDVVTEFEAEALPYVTINGVKGTAASVANATELNAAIEAGRTDIYLADGTYTIPASAKGKTLTINGGTGAVIQVQDESGDGSSDGSGVDYNLDGSTVTFNGVTIDTTAQNGLHRGFARMTGVYNNCRFVGTYTLGTGTSKFYNCIFDLKNNYVWTWGASEVLFDTCTFEDSNGIAKAILVHNTVVTEVTVKDCKFVATTGATTWDGLEVAAVSIDPENGSPKATVKFEGTNTCSEAFYSLYQLKYGSEASVVTVTVDGKAVEVPVMNPDK